MPINIKLDTAALLQWGKRQSQLPKEIRQATARSLNKVGRHALDTVVDRLSQESGLSPATVRRRFTLDLASENNLVFAINANQEIEINKSSRPMPGRSFAKRPDSYFREGELVNIVTMGDDRVCPLCEALAEGSPYTIEEARAQIPHHPNAVLQGSTFMSYGPLREMARAVFSGFAIDVRTSTKVITIGPNHPMLTRSGFVKASELRKGDELLYDLRTHGVPVSRPSIGACDISDLEYMPMVEDVFETFAAAGIPRRCSVASGDLHGDGIFCQSEVEIVIPTWQLLPVLDTCGCQHFRKDNFTRTDVGLAFEPSPSRSTFTRYGMFHATDSGVGSCDLEFALATGHSRPLDKFLFARGTTDHISTSNNSIDSLAGYSEFLRQSEDADSSRIRGNNWPFRWERVLVTHAKDFSGFAFDASTQTGVYCSDGFVVKNCRCAVEPASTGPGKVVADKFRPAVPEVMPGGEVTLQELTTALADEVRVIFKAV
jgi:hypothetical protein